MKDINVALMAVNTPKILYTSIKLLLGNNNNNEKDNDSSPPNRIYLFLPLPIHTDIATMT